MGVETNSGGAEESELAAAPAASDDKGDGVRRGRRMKTTVTEIEEPDEELVAVIVAPGRTVNDGVKVHGPGTQIKVSSADAVMLASAGHAKPPGKPEEIRPQTGPRVRDDTK